MGLTIAERRAAYPSRLAVVAERKIVRSTRRVAAVVDPVRIAEFPRD